MDLKQLEELSKNIPEADRDFILEYVAKNGMEGFNQQVKAFNGIIQLSGIESAGTEWLWKPYIPRGKVTIISADPGTGKTYFCLYLAAAVSTGRPFYGQLPDLIREPANVIYQTAEDGIADTIKPRLEPMQPDFSKIYIIDESNEGLSLSDDRIEFYMSIYRPALMIFDPLQAYLGADVDMHRANEVRPILSKIGHLAERYECAIVFVMHNSKMGSNKALYRALGSMDIPAIARSMLVMAKNPENEEQKLICHEKSSLARHGKSILMRIAPEQDGVVFDGFTDLKADDILTPAKDGRNKPSVKKDEVEDKLVELLFSNDGAVSLEQVEELQRECGWGKSTLYNVKCELKLKSVVTGFGNYKKSWWLLPDKDVRKFKEQLKKIEGQTAINS